ncbi:MAG: hypothetical protein Q4E13_13315 [Clostridia bacterium]|nr:hypothetical protein [Clostridia bacterium]
MSESMGQEAANAFSHRVFADVEHGGPAVEHPERFFKEVEAGIEMTDNGRYGPTRTPPTSRFGWARRGRRVNQSDDVAQYLSENRLLHYIISGQEVQ